LLRAYFARTAGAQPVALPPVPDAAEKRPRNDPYPPVGGYGIPKKSPVYSQM
jgi:hypothetical protein